MTQAPEHTCEFTGVGLKVADGEWVEVLGCTSVFCTARAVKVLPHVPDGSFCARHITCDRYGHPFKLWPANPCSCPLCKWES